MIILKKGSQFCIIEIQQDLLGRWYVTRKSGNKCWQGIQIKTYEFYPEQMAKLFSFIDALAKKLNTIYKPYIYIAMYEAYLDAEIYRHLHPTLKIYDFVKFQYIRPETVTNMKQYYNISIKVLEKLKLPPKEQSVITKTM